MVPNALSSYMHLMQKAYRILPLEYILLILLVLQVNISFELHHKYGYLVVLSMHVQ